MKACFNLEPEQSDDESSSLDDIIDQHVQDQEHTSEALLMMAELRARKAVELNEEDGGAGEDDNEEDSRDDSNEAV